jgi:hypothetical protein
VIVVANSVIAEPTRFVMSVCAAAVLLVLVMSGIFADTANQVTTYHSEVTESQSTASLSSPTHGKAVVIVTHDSHLASIADRVLHLAESEPVNAGAINTNDSNNGRIHG